MKKDNREVLIWFLVMLIVMIIIMAACTKKEDTPPPCYECIHKSYLDSLTLVGKTKYFKCDDNIEVYEAEHTGWGEFHNYYYKMECKK